MSSDLQGRFPNLSSEQLEEILSERNSENTLKANKTAVRIFETFLKSRSSVDTGTVVVDGESEPGPEPAEAASRVSAIEGEARGRDSSERPVCVESVTVGDNVSVTDHDQTESISSSTNWASLDLEELGEHLYNFYASARNKKNELYKKSTLQSIRSGLNRHLNDVRRKHDKPAVDLVRDPPFAKANQMFLAMGKVLKKEGKATVEHYPPIETEDLRTLYKYFTQKILNESNPRAIQQCVFVNIVIYFARRGRENLRKLKISDFAVTSDAAGDMYMYKITDERTKNHQDDASQKQARMYQIKESAMCPVKVFVKYKRLLNPKLNVLFQKPKKEVTSADRVWYDAAPIGEHTLGSMMKDISTAAGLSIAYTNHSLRATTVTLLNDASLEGRDIIAVTEHRSVNSLTSYTRTSDKKIKKMSGILSYGLEGNDTGDFENESMPKLPDPQLQQATRATPSLMCGNALPSVFSSRASTAVSANDSVVHKRKALDPLPLWSCCSATHVPEPNKRQMLDPPSTNVSTCAAADSSLPRRSVAKDPAGPQRQHSLNNFLGNQTLPALSRSSPANGPPVSHKHVPEKQPNALCLIRSPARATASSTWVPTASEHNNGCDMQLMSDDDMDTIMRDLKIPQMPPSQQTTLSRSEHVDLNKMMQPVFNNCQVTINYNFKK